MATRMADAGPAARDLTNHVGREGGADALDFYAEPRNICIKL